MLLLFRRIRSGAIDTSNVKKYLLYAVGEIVLIVIGILIALQISNLDESRKTGIEEATALRLLRENLEDEVAGFDAWIRTRVETDIPYLTRIYEKRWDGIPLDSLPLVGTRYFNFQPFDATYEGLKSGGELSLIENDGLRGKVISYYEREHVHLADWSSWHKNFVTNTLEPLMYDELYIGPDELVADVDHLERQLGTRRLNSLISTQIGSLRRLGVEIEEAKGYAEEIIAAIDEELAGG